MFHAGKHVVARWSVVGVTPIDQVERAISRATDLMVARRVLREKGLVAVTDESRSVATATETTMQRVEVLPPIQIRGLAQDVSLVRRGISRLRELITDVHAARSGLEQDLGDIREQITEHRRDIRFEAEQLGNGEDSKE